MRSAVNGNLQIMLNMMLQNEISLFLFQGGGGGGMSQMLVMMLPLLLVFWFLLIRPQKQQKRWQAMINDLKTGDRVTTQGGIRGIIIAVKDDALHLRVAPDNLRLEVTKSAVVSLVRDEEEKKS